MSCESYTWRTIIKKFQKEDGLKKWNRFHINNDNNDNDNSEMEKSDVLYGRFLLGETFARVDHGKLLCELFMNVSVERFFWLLEDGWFYLLVCSTRMTLQQRFNCVCARTSQNTNFFNGNMCDQKVVYGKLFRNELQKQQIMSFLVDDDDENNISVDGVIDLIVSQKSRYLYNRICICLLLLESESENRKYYFFTQILKHTLARIGSGIIMTDRDFDFENLQQIMYIYEQTMIRNNSFEDHIINLFLSPNREIPYEGTVLLNKLYWTRIKLPYVVSTEFTGVDQKLFQILLRIYLKIQVNYLKEQNQKQTKQQEQDEIDKKTFNNLFIRHEISKTIIFLDSYTNGYYQSIINNLLEPTQQLKLLKQETTKHQTSHFPILIHFFPNVITILILSFTWPSTPLF